MIDACNVPTRRYAIVGFVLTIALATLSWYVVMGPLGFQGNDFGFCTGFERDFPEAVVCDFWLKRRVFVVTIISQFGRGISSSDPDLIGFDPGSTSLFVFVSGLLGLAVFFPAFFVAWRFPYPQWRSLGVLAIFGIAGSVLASFVGFGLAIFGIFGPYQIIWQTMLLVGVGFVADRWGTPSPPGD